VTTDKGQHSDALCLLPRIPQSSVGLVSSTNKERTAGFGGNTQRQHTGLVESATAALTRLVVLTLTPEPSGACIMQCDDCGEISMSLKRWLAVPRQRYYRAQSATRAGYAPVFTAAELFALVARSASASQSTPMHRSHCAVQQPMMPTRCRGGAVGGYHR
jgi:hypothetical protein